MLRDRRDLSHLSNRNNEVGLKGRIRRSLLSGYGDSICRAVARAMSSPKARATTVSAISMPAEMPADVSTRPSSTTCFWNSTITSGKASRIQCNDRHEWLRGVRSTVRRNPAASIRYTRRSGFRLPPRERAAMQAWPGCSIPCACPSPRALPGYQGGDNSQRCNVEGLCMLPVVVTGSGCSATSHTSKGDGSSLRFSSLRRAAEKTSSGPQKSSTSMSSKRTIPTVSSPPVSPSNLTAESAGE